MNFSSVWERPRISEKMVEKCLRQCPVLRTAFTQSSPVCATVPYRAVPCLTVAQLSVASHRADSLVLSKRLTAAPVPRTACGLTPLDERRELRSNLGDAKKTQEVTRK